MAGSNCLQHLRLSRGLTRREMAEALAVSYDELAMHETGRYDRLRPKLRLALIHAGFDGESIAQEYRDWIEKRAASYQDRLHGVGGGA